MKKSPIFKLEAMNLDVNDLSCLDCEGSAPGISLTYRSLNNKDNSVIMNLKRYFAMGRPDHVLRNVFGNLVGVPEALIPRTLEEMKNSWKPQQYPVVFAR